MNFVPTSGQKPAYHSKDVREIVGKTKMHEEINAGRLKARRIGRKLIFLHDDFEAWLAALPSVSAAKTRKAA